MRIREVGFGSPGSRQVALAVFNGSGDAEVSGNALASSGPVKTGSRVEFPSQEFPPSEGGVITGTFGELTDDPDNVLITVFGTDYGGGGHSRVPARFYIDNYILPSIPGSSFAGWAPDVVTVNSTMPDGSPGPTRFFRTYFIQRPPSKEAYVDLDQSSVVVSVPLAPPTVPPGQTAPPSDPPATLTFSIPDLPAGAVAGVISATVTGYAPIDPTPEVPTPPGMAFHPQSDGTMTIENGVAKWSFSASHPDMVPGGAANVVYKFNTKGLIG